MSFLRPELAARLRRWREALLWAALTGFGAWLAWRGYGALAPLPFVVGLLAAAAGLGLLQAAVRRLRLSAGAMDEGVVVIDEARIAYLGPRQGGVVDLPAVVSVEIVTRPHLPLDSGHAWVITTDDGTRLTIPLGARGADGLLDALTLLPGIDFDAGVAAVAGGGAGRTTVWKKAG
jgi:hypothetical protein